VRKESAMRVLHISICVMRRATFVAN